MGRADGRVQPGQRLDTAFSARAWNRAQDAADIVLGDRLAVGADGVGGGVLPSLRAKLPIKGFFGRVAWLASVPSSQQSLLTVSQPPAAPSTAWSYGTFEGNLPSFGTELLRMGNATGSNWAVSTLDRETAAREPLFAICTDNDSHVWTLSGLAIARVRVFNWAHRYARLAMAFPGSTDEQNTDAAGCLDSAFYGPAKIVGYAQVDTNGFGFSYPTGNIGGNWPTFQLRWALVQF